jgi:hypothetical protein
MEVVRGRPGRRSAQRSPTLAKMLRSLGKMLKALPPELQARLRALPAELLQSLLEQLSAMGKNQNLRATVESFLDLHLEEAEATGQ